MAGDFRGVCSLISPQRSAGFDKMGIIVFGPFACLRKPDLKRAASLEEWCVLRSSLRHASV